MSRKQLQKRGRLHLVCKLSNRSGFERAEPWTNLCFCAPVFGSTENDLVPLMSFSKSPHHHVPGRDTTRWLCVEVVADFATPVRKRRGLKSRDPRFPAAPAVPPPPLVGPGLLGPLSAADPAASPLPACVLPCAAPMWHWVKGWKQQASGFLNAADWTKTRWEKAFARSRCPQMEPTDHKIQSRQSFLRQHSQ